MKNIKIWSFVMLFALALVGCGDNNELGNEPGNGPGEGSGNKPAPDPSGLASAIVGEWHLNAFDGAQTEYFDVYLEFKAGGSFDMYQRLYTLNYEYYSGSYNVSGSIITGSYDDGKNWLSGYKAEVSADGKTLTMHSQEDISLTSVYTSEAIPEEVKAEAEATRADDRERFL